VNKNYVLSREYGIGIMRRDQNKFLKYTTLSKNAVSLMAARNLKSEEMRVLYVALTRAKEKLIMISNTDNAEKTLKNIASKMGRGDVLSPFETTGMMSYSEWILSAALRHPSFKAFRDKADIGEECVVDADFPFKAVLANRLVSEEETFNTKRAKVNEELKNEIDERLSYRYPYDSLVGVIAKYSASGLNSEEGIDEHFASSVPSFASDGGMTAAQRGTAVHKFMQLADFKKIGAFGVESELSRLYNEGYLTNDERKAADRPSVRAFFKSEAAKRIFSSEKVFREKRFTIEKNASDIHGDLPENTANEKIIIQGMVDCAFVEDGKIVVLDYKTDRCSTEELKERYKNQLLIYGDAMRAITGMDIKELILYSFYNGDTVTV
nr:PD-(D/E)XK nuclease family protein [Clostridiales bacterium]